MNNDPNSNYGGTPYGGPPIGGPPTYLQPHRGTMILVFGILSLICCGPLGIAAWIMGNSDLSAMREGRMDRSGEGTTRGGQICGIIGTVIWILMILGYVGLIALGIGAGAFSGTTTTPTP